MCPALTGGAFLWPLAAAQAPVEQRAYVRCLHFLIVQWICGAYQNLMKFLRVTKCRVRQKIIAKSVNCEPLSIHRERIEKYD